MNADLHNTIFLQAVSFVNQTSKHLFITGKAGTGKTTFLKYIREHSHKKMAIIAPTGVAAINAGGMTIHSFFQLPTGAFIPVDGGGWLNNNQEVYNRSTLLKKLRLRGEKRDVIRQLEVLIIDEVSMVRADLLDAIDTVLRHIRQQPLIPFGGVQMVYIGDLFQLPPVTKQEEWKILEQYYKSPFFFDATALQHSQPLYLELKKMYRQKDDAFISILNNVRNNCCTEEDFEAIHRQYDPDFTPPKYEQYITLTSHNNRANAINQRELQQLRGKEFVYEAEITGDFNDRSYPADKELRLKAGAQIMFIKNDKGEARRYYNGKIGTIHSLDDDKIVVQFEDETDTFELEKEKWENIRYTYDHEKDNLNQEELGTFSQYPIRLAWAITIHKSQGLTFEKAIVDAGASFAPGQVYVSLSRLTSLKGLILQSRILPGSINTDKRVIDYTSIAKSEDEIEKILEAEKKLYLPQYLIQRFSWDSVDDIVNNRLMKNDEVLSLEIPDTIAWASSVFEKSEQLKEVADKFIRQLGFLFQTAEGDNFKTVFERTDAASKYFISAIDEYLIKQTEVYCTAIKSNKKLKKHIKDIQLLLSVFRNKKQKIEQAAKLGLALHQSKELQQFFEVINKSTDTSKNADNPVKKEKINIEKGSSKKFTLNEFKNGKSIAEIAQERNFTIGTIETHLISFIATGEIKIEELVSKQVVETVINILNKHPQLKLSEIKQMAGDGITYNEIRAVAIYKENFV